MFYFTIKQFLASKGIEKPLVWMRNAGIDYRTAVKLLNNQYSERVPMTVVSLFCEKAWCTPNDIITWKPDNPDVQLPENHPLHKLKPKYETFNMASQLKNFTPDQLEKVHEFVIGMQKDGVKEN